MDYLYAEDRDFKSDFNIKEIKYLYDFIDDVISTNIHNGYWIITGANSGIGYELARKLDGLKKNLILIDKNTDNLKSFEKHTILKKDLSTFEEIENLAKIINQYKIYCLINNAGVGFRGSLQDLDIEKIKKSVNINIYYPVFFTKLLLDNLIKNESVIVNISSSIAYNPLPYMSLYSATKAFMSNWSESLSYELRKTNKVITFSPSGTYTNFQKNAGVKVAEKGRGLLKPEYVAEEIIKAVDGKKTTVILGFKTKILLMISRLLPRKINIYLWGKLFEQLR
ncbi:MAG: SDR family NAD(P)-dependent oxidoreductase [Nitrospirae bacterium]|nr:SDR family NAD(P)-dependent oxidoreductase [Nitrospirota bacterium]